MKLTQVLKAIDDEQEYPGEMPEHTFLTMKCVCALDDRNLAAEMIRVAVRATKDGIRKRVLELSK